MDGDELKGKAKDFTGKAEEAVGGAIGDEALEAQGRVDQAAGKAQKLYGAAKHAVDSAADAAGEAFATARDAVGATWSDAAGAETVPPEEAAGEDILDWATGIVRERPMLALLGAAATGYALAFLLHGGRR